ncbi:hypothetical protein [Streptomyces gobitricini]
MTARSRGRTFSHSRPGPVAGALRPHRGVQYGCGGWLDHFWR